MEKENKKNEEDTKSEEDKKCDERIENLIEELDKTVKKCSDENERITYGEIIAALNVLKENLEEECDESESDELNEGSDEDESDEEKEEESDEEKEDEDESELVEEKEDEE